VSGLARKLLTLAGVLVFGVSAFHVACAIIGPAAYRYFGAGEQMASRAASGSPIPALVTLLLAALFAIFAVYALSAAGRLRLMPQVRGVTVGVGVVFALRGLLVVPEVGRLLRDPGSVPVRAVLFSVIALAIGALYLVGVIVGWQGVTRRTRGHDLG
jgi:hypothetical protein